MTSTYTETEMLNQEYRKGDCVFLDGTIEDPGTAIRGMEKRQLSCRYDWISYFDTRNNRRKAGNAYYPYAHHEYFYLYDWIFTFW